MAEKVVNDSKAVLIDEVLEVNRKLAGLLICAEFIGPSIEEASIKEVVIRVYGKGIPRCDSVDPVRKNKHVVLI